jgi:hypothetical protein
LRVEPEEAELLRPKDFAENIEGDLLRVEAAEELEDDAGCCAC